VNTQLVFDLASVSVGTRLRNREVLRRWQPEGNWVFDCGCGVGVFCRDLIKRGVNPIGMEYDYDKARVAHQKLGAPFFAGDITSLPLKSESAPVILVRDVLEHLPDDTKAFSELKRCLAPGGKLLITVPNHNWRLFYKLARIKPQDHGHYRLYDKSDLTEKLKGLDFSVEKAEHIENPLATLLEFLILLASLLFFGEKKVKDAKMNQITSSKRVLPFFYKLISHLIWPFIIIAEIIFPKNLGSEILIIARKK